MKNDQGAIFIITDYQGILSIIMTNNYQECLVNHSNG